MISEQQQQQKSASNQELEGNILWLIKFAWEESVAHYSW